MRKPHLKRSKPPRVEYKRFSEQLVDCILDSKQPWLVQYVLSGGLAYIPTQEELSSGIFALKMLTSLERDTLLWPESLYEAFAKRDRSPVLAWTLERTIERKPTTDEMRRLLACVNSTVLRKSLKKLNQTFTFHSGAKRKLPAAQYPRLLETADLLEPVILQLLSFPRTSHTLTETLRYLKKDHQKACEFLNRHASRFQQALAEPRLLQRAKRNLASRARVLAEAMAGADYQLTFSTSRERMRQARHSAEGSSR